ncbi:MAG: hypothetical protein J3Q66DRAFT_407690 [Benniella sp.]|nr:MAG: hypothetical protein J3Q66DRAFT_407690 [Benniella sp.]
MASFGSVDEAQFLDLTQDSDGEEAGSDALQDYNLSTISISSIFAGSNLLDQPVPAESSSRLPSFKTFDEQQQQFAEEQERKRAEAEEQRRLLLNNFIGVAQDMFENISVRYLEELVKETWPKISTDTELVETCIEKIFALKGQYPKAKRKRREYEHGDGAGCSTSQEPQPRDVHDGEETSSEEDDEEENGDGVHVDTTGESSSRPPRNYMDYGTKMSAAYETQCSVQLYQDFPKVAAASIRACLKKFNYHYAPAFEYLNSLWTTFEARGNSEKKKAGEITLVLVAVPRKKKGFANPQSLDPEFKKELEWIKSKIAKELEEIQAIEEEERNFKYHQDRNELIECGCCYDDVAPNRVAQCEDGHLFCLECSRRGAEAELGYRRTVLKCMTAGCPSVFNDSEAIKFLSKPVFRGLLKARQQSELKMAELDSLVECPFCSYAAVVENDQDKEFRCQAPKCRKVSCRYCKELTHIPLSCEEHRKEQEKNNVLTVQHKAEEEMTQALLRECPKCKARFFKTEGCNKMTCPECHTKMCYVCKQQIKDYSHFDQTPAGQAPTNSSRCRLWDNTVERNANDVKAAAQRALQELKASKPELADQVRLDIP